MASNDLRPLCPDCLEVMSRSGGRREYECDNCGWPGSVKLRKVKQITELSDHSRTGGDIRAAVKENEWTFDLMGEMTSEEWEKVRSWFRSV